jgi:small subunit ribosomal protein S4
MARQQARERISRRLGTDLGLKGLRAARGKGGLARRPYPPGQHGQRYRRKRSEYLQQLEEKQKARFFYGVRESELRRYFDRASRGREPTGDVLVRLLESRLDSVLARLGLAATRAQARQFISHGHVQVDGERVNIPSYGLSPGDEVRIRPGSRIEPLVQVALELTAEVPAWLERGREGLAGRVKSLPERSEVQVPFDETQIIEFYSR